MNVSCKSSHCGDWSCDDTDGATCIITWVHVEDGNDGVHWHVLLESMRLAWTTTACLQWDTDIKNNFTIFQSSLFCLGCVCNLVQVKDATHMHTIMLQSSELRDIMVLALPIGMITRKTNMTRKPVWILIILWLRHKPPIPGIDDGNFPLKPTLRPSN